MATFVASQPTHRDTYFFDLTKSKKNKDLPISNNVLVEVSNIIDCLAIFLSRKGSFRFTIDRESSNDIQSNSPQEVELGLQDEMILTQLALDNKDIVIYEIASALYLCERHKNSLLSTFKCFFDKQSKNFYLELSDKSPFEHLTKSTFLKILDIAENVGAERVYVCLHKKITEIDNKIQTLLFVGFKKLVGEELEKIQRVSTHILMKYNLGK